MNTWTPNRIPTNGRARLSHWLFGVACVMLMASCGATEHTIVADPAASPPPATPEPTAAAPAEQPDPTAPPSAAAPTAAAVEQPEPTATVSERLQVLVVTTLLPRGTLVRELLDAPTAFLSARAVPADQVSPGALLSIAELQELDGFATTVDLLPGEQLLRTEFVDPGVASAPPIPKIDVAIPAGHDATVLVLPPERAVGGLIRAGELVRVIGTEGGNGDALSSVLVALAEVVGFEALLGSDVTAVGPFEYAITVAVRPDEASALSAALEQLASISLAAQSPISGEYAIAIEMSKAQALDGGVRAGDTVTVLSASDSTTAASTPIVVATEVEVLNVAADIQTESIYSIAVSVNEDELLALTSAVANGEVSLADS